jgi:CshA-type fibril repeat protein
MPALLPTPGPRRPLPARHAIARAVALGLLLAVPGTAAAATPVVSGLSQTWGAATGGTPITITGSGLAGATGVSFGGVPALDFAVVDDGTVTATAPAQAAGAVDVTVEDGSGTSATSCADAFAYVADPGTPLPAHGCAVAFPLQTTAVGGGQQARTLSVPVGGSATLLDAGNAPTDVVTTPAGSYVLDGPLLTYTPATGYLGDGAVSYQLLGDGGSSAVSTYATTVTKPAAPVAPVVTSLGDPGLPQLRALAVIAGEQLQMLDAANHAVDSVIVSGEGRYDLHLITTTIVFYPAPSFRGTAHGIHYRLTDEYGQSAVGSYVPTVSGGTGGGGGGGTGGGTGGSGGGSPALRLTTAVLNVADANGRLPVGCAITSGLVADCSVTLVAQVSGRPVTVGTGFASPPGAVSSVVVAITLTGRGRDLARRPGGIAVRADGSVAVAGMPGRVVSAVDFHAVAESFLLSHGVRFATRSSRLPAAERRYLKSLARTLHGVRRVECIGTARDVRAGARRTRLARARARAVCAYLRPQLAHGTVLAPRAAHAGDRRGTSRHADLQLRY